MLEMNTTIAFPAAPLLTVILALVGKFAILICVHMKLFPTTKPALKGQLSLRTTLNMHFRILKAAMTTKNV